MTKQRGFTLIELMVVVVVMAILAALAYAAYTKQVSKGRRSDAYSSVGQLQLSLERWRAENPCYGLSTVAPCSAVAFIQNGTYPTAPTSKYYTTVISNAGPTTYTVTAAPISTSPQANDLCGSLIATWPPVPATGNGKPTWGTASCN